MIAAFRAVLVLYMTFRAKTAKPAAVKNKTAQRRFQFRFCKRIDSSIHCFKIPERENSRIHIPRTVRQIVRLVHQEKEAFFFPFGILKIPAKKYGRVKCVVVIAYNDLAITRKIQRKLIRAN